MKKFIAGLIILGMVVGMLIPIVVSADCLPECCCCAHNRWYKVSYFDENHDWVIQRVSAWSASIAASKLGLTAGRGCFVLSDGVDYEPRMFLYKVSHFDDNHNWVSEYVEGENREDAVDKLGVEGGHIVRRAFEWEDEISGITK